MSTTVGKTIPNVQSVECVSKTIVNMSAMLALLMSLLAQPAGNASATIIALMNVIHVNKKRHYLVQHANDPYVIPLDLRAFI